MVLGCESVHCSGEESTRDAVCFLHVGQKGGFEPRWIMKEASGQMAVGSDLASP